MPSKRQQLAKGYRKPAGKAIAEIETNRTRMRYARREEETIRIVDAFIAFAFLQHTTGK